MLLQLKSSSEMFTFLILFLCAIFHSVLSVPAISLPQCKIDDDTCVTNAAKAVFPLLLQPNAEIGVETMDPLFNEEIKGHLSILKYELYNTTTTGFGSCEVQNAKFLDAAGDNLRITFLCPKFVLEGLYTINGLLIILHVEGEGDYKIETKKYSVAVDLELKTINKGGKNYKHIKSFKLKMEPLENVVFDFRNLFNGRKDLADVVLKFANQSWKEVATEFQEPIFKAVYKKIVKNVNKHLLTIPVD